MLNYAKLKGFPSNLYYSTGKKSPFMMQLSLMDGLLFVSLPDSHGLMTGIKVTAEYAELLDFAMSYRLEKLKQNENIELFVLVKLSSAYQAYHL